MTCMWGSAQIKTWFFENLLNKFSPKKEWFWGTPKPLPIRFFQLISEVLGLKDCARPSGAGKSQTSCKVNHPTPRLILPSLTPGAPNPPTPISNCTQVCLVGHVNWHYNRPDSEWSTQHEVCFPTDFYFVHTYTHALNIISVLAWLLVQCSIQHIIQLLT